ncbi:MAG: hypothetical protein M1832_004990 [Thelocarpon impressellum]|nr:MAG: hypothetical protein M1832_004990 [Thelocarpon impressellum]
MSGKKAPAVATDDELLSAIDSIGNDSAPAKAPAKSSSASRTPKPSAPNEEDLLAELGSLAAPRPESRPVTPRISQTAASGTPPATSARTSEERAHTSNAPRKSGESSRSYHTTLTPATSGSTAEAEADPEGRAAWEVPAPAHADGGGGWWGGILSTASAAVKTAEAAVKEIQKNEEAQRWAEQVKGNVGALRGLGGELRSRALPTFTNILHTLAPPISSHERLQIHITHDFVGYPSLDPLIYSTFSRVMAQVEGGDLMVIQRGHESSPRRASDAGFTGSGVAGWSDGPWWRQETERRSLGAVKGVTEGGKLVRVGAEAYAHEFYAARGGVEVAAQRAAEVLSESNPVRSSDIFLAIQAIQHEEEPAGPSAAGAEGGVVDAESKPDELLSFAIYLHDPVHSITFGTRTQALPQKWLDWLDASVPARQEAGEDTAGSALPVEIAEIIASGGVDPREWVAEWVEETLSLGVGVVAQRYVARRMGVGEGGIGRGKKREEAIEGGGGEAARAI